MSIPATSTSEKVLYSGRTHTSGGRDGHARSADGFVDLTLKQPHPAAENLFAAAWSACFIAAVQVAAAQRKVALPASPEIDAEIDLNQADGAYFLRARLNVSVPGVDKETARTLVDAAHEICPYSKATRGNIDVALNVI